MKEELKAALVKTIGWPAPLFHSDTAVLDRWLWLRKRVPRGDGTQQAIELGCGSGAFTIGVALRGYQALGLSYDVRNQAAAARRAHLCGAATAKFEVQDIRALNERADVQGKFDVVIMTEVIEHILDDRKLLEDAAKCLKGGGSLLLTTPNVDLHPIDPLHNGPFSTVEDGGHVRKGYAAEDLIELSMHAGLVTPEISYCTGLLSQKITRLHFVSKKIHPVVAWGLVNPFRPLPLLFDSLVTKLTAYPSYSICLEARKP